MFFVFSEKPIVACLGRNGSCNVRDSEVEENPITLTCQVEGHPQPEIFWKFKPTKKTSAQMIDTSDDVIIDFHNGSLHIKKLIMRHSGYYECFANNSLGYDSATMYLQVKSE